MGYRPKRRPAAEQQPEAPLMPAEIAEYRPLDWLNLSDPVEPPADGRDVAAWSRWEEA